ncbi:hypothetical protein EJ04DRAFT_230497 [Polyplosphaeria fusca]|uniref:Uncharacterized protein n=1 Tax=Polyplosphaeria fusca TaxID=682080 RepID=A0A9P4QXU0_9PLEO|nr:hypothetical protein EJ04DRAFT_230497 [Polyplosphaeria fusca]
MDAWNADDAFAFTGQSRLLDLPPQRAMADGGARRSMQESQGMVSRARAMQATGIWGEGFRGGGRFAGRGGAMGRQECASSKQHATRQRRRPMARRGKSDVQSGGAEGEGRRRNSSRWRAAMGGPFVRWLCDRTGMMDGWTEAGRARVRLFFFRRGRGICLDARASPLRCALQLPVGIAPAPI